MAILIFGEKSRKQVVAKFYSFIFTCFFAVMAYGQGATCANIQAFCADNTGSLVFENSNPHNTSQTYAESGPDYGCLDIVPYPSWFYLQIDDPGDTRFRVSQVNDAGEPLDVDYIVWGPFQSGDDLCDFQDGLTEENTVSCSYEVDAVEYFDILGAQSGEIYVVLITNYAGYLEFSGQDPTIDSAGNISLEQTNLNQPGAGSTDCTIVEGLLGPNIVTCETDPITLDATFATAMTYEWAEDLGSGYVPRPETGPTITVNQSGDYQVTITEFDGDVESDFINIQYVDAPVANMAADIEECDQGDGTAVFDLTVRDSDILGAQDPQFYQLAYYNSQADAENRTDPIAQPDAYVGQAPNEDIYARVDYQGIEDQCFDITSFAVIVNELPQITQEELQGGGTVAICLEPTGMLLGEDLGPGYVYDWTPDNDTNGDAVEEPVFDVQNGGTYTLVVTNQTTGCQSELYTARFVEQPVANQPADLMECEEENASATFDLTAQDATILGTQDPADYSVEYFTFPDDANMNVGAIENPEAYVGVKRQTIIARVDYTAEPNVVCYETTQFDIIVNPKPRVNDPHFDQEGSFICVDESGAALDGGVVIGEDLGPGYTYDWTPDNDMNGDGIEEPYFNVVAGGDYSLVVINNSTGCRSDVYTATFQPSAPPDEVTITIETDSFSENSLYTVSVGTEGGFGEFPYEYALDDPLGYYQSSATFTNVPPGDHIVYVRDVNGCGVTISDPFKIIDYPKYFTPNGDGINDTWNILGLDPQLNGASQLYIFDRYGKLLKQVNPFGEGWNGTYRGELLPSDTYWFRIEYIEPRDGGPRTFRAHFLLKR